jgi:hypothetical protein
MLQVLQQIFDKALARLGQQLTTYVPPLLIAIVIIAVAYLLARVVRWLILRAVKGISLDRFLRESGLSSMLDRSGRLRSASVVAGAAYWAILGVGLLTAVDVFDTKLTSQIVESTVLLLPKLLTAGAILVAGFWLAQYLSRSMVLWAVNENIPLARRLAAVVRTAVGFFAVVVAAEVLNFASHVFFAAFVIFAGAVALATGLGVGFGVRGAVRKFILRKGEQPPGEPEKSLWNHL